MSPIDVRKLAQDDRGYSPASAQEHRERGAPVRVSRTVGMRCGGTTSGRPSSRRRSASSNPSSTPSARRRWSRVARGRTCCRGLRARTRGAADPGRSRSRSASRRSGWSRHGQEIEEIHSSAARAAPGADPGVAGWTRRRGDLVRSRRPRGRRRDLHERNAERRRALRRPLRHGEEPDLRSARRWTATETAVRSAGPRRPGTPQGGRRDLLNDCRDRRSEPPAEEADGRRGRSRCAARA